MKVLREAGGFFPGGAKFWTWRPPDGKSRPGATARSQAGSVRTSAPHAYNQNLLGEMAFQYQLSFCNPPLMSWTMKSPSGTGVPYLTVWAPEWYGAPDSEPPNYKSLAQLTDPAIQQALIALAQRWNLPGFAIAVEWAEVGADDRKETTVRFDNWNDDPDAS